MPSPYVIITPARNEELNIRKTIQSVLGQTVKPRKWVVVSDGSTDRTDEIAKQYATQFDFMHFIRRESNGERNFGSKADAIELGLRHVSNLDYDFVAILDADVSFNPDYYEKVLTKFHENLELGIAGGVIFTVKGNVTVLSTTDLNHVAGAVQTFRRQCFRDIGGYMAIPIGGIDKIAETMARMKGWQTTSFTDIEVLHHQQAGTKVNSVYAASYKGGVKDSLIGYHPLYFVIRSFYRIFRKHYLIGAVLGLFGFCSSMLFGGKRPVPDEFVAFLRKEQKERLLSLSKKRKESAFR